jgi:MFS family permease
MRLNELYPMERAARAKGQIRDGLRYVRSRPDLILILFIVGMVGTFGFNFQMTTALMARMEFHKGATEYGLLGSIMAIGSLAGALLAARRERPRLRLVVGATLAFGVFAVLASAMPTYELFAISLIPVGLSSLTLMTAANATVQMSTDPAMRGRVMALYMAIFMGGTPLGAPLIGWVGEEFGARWTIAVGGLISLAVAVVAILQVTRNFDVTVRYRIRKRPHLLVHVAIHEDGVESPREAARQRLAGEDAGHAANAA